MTEKENRRPMGEKRRSTNGYSFSKRRAVGSAQTTPARLCMRPISELYKEYGVPMPLEDGTTTTAADDDERQQSINCISPISTCPSESKATSQLRLTVDSLNASTPKREEKRESTSQAQPLENGEDPDDPSALIACRALKNEAATDCADRKPVGLANIGNSCFINAVLRALLSLKKVRDEINQPETATADESLERNLCKVYEYTEQRCAAKEFNLRNVIRGIWKSSSLEQFRQHDAHEFLLALFEKLPFADQCFGIPLQIQVQCTSCRQLRVRYDRTLDLSASPCGRQQDDEVRKLSDCLRRTFGPELVSDLPCDRCRNCNASVVRRIMALPLLLVLCLMRFDYRQKTDDQGRNAVKLNDSVAIPAEINLEPFCLRPSMPARYELRAIVSHCGYSVEYGHYVCDAVANCRQNGERAAEEQWFSFNDRDVERKELSGILQQRQRTAYLLFYQKIET